MKSERLIVWMFCGLIPYTILAQPDSSSCKIFLENDTLFIQNNLVEFAYDWNGGELIPLYQSNHMYGARLLSTTQNPDFILRGESNETHSGTLTSEWKRDLYNPGSWYLEAEIRFSKESLEVMRRIRMYPNASAVQHRWFFRGTPTSASWKLMVDSNTTMVETDVVYRSENSYLARLDLDNPHWQLKIVNFAEATDHHNTLVWEKNFLPYRTKEYAQANLVYGINKVTNQGFFILKESPLGKSQHAYEEVDIGFDKQSIFLYGVGVRPEDIHSEEWVSGYGYVLYISNGDEKNLRKNLRMYQKQVRNNKHDRDDMILANTWGDRSKDARMNEEFILGEIGAAVKLGITHLQLDDGWQSGLSKNSASKAGQQWDAWTYNDWQPHPTRFPNGFDSIIQKARQYGIEICLWFNPSKVNDYALWKRDADLLIEYYEKYGIRIFKIDGIELSSKQSEINLRRLFDRVTTSTNGNAVFNLDVTAGHRMGYHFFNEYGNIFLENRYTDWANYFPYQTLRNLWMLSGHMPPERLQIEFLNPWRNQDKYLKGDPLAPENIPFEYMFAITLMAQPLAWMELSSLPEKAISLAPVIEKYKLHSADIHRGVILPIGDKPDGFSWTGFQSMHDNYGYFLIFRENNRNQQFSIPTYLEKGQSIKLTSILGQGKSFSFQTGEGGSIIFELPDNFTYGLFKYTLTPR